MGASCCGRCHNQTCVHGLEDTDAVVAKTDTACFPEGAYCGERYWASCCGHCQNEKCVAGPTPAPPPRPPPSDCRRNGEYCGERYWASCCGRCQNRTCIGGFVSKFDDVFFTLAKESVFV